jgi:putative hydrolase of the HAD superfamily
MQSLLIDLDDTLLDDRSATANAFAALMQAHAQVLRSDDDSLLLEKWRAIANFHWSRFQNDEVTFQGQRRDRIRQFLERQLTDSEADRAMQPYVREYERSWKLFPDVPDFLSRTKNQPKVIVTNGQRDQQMQKIHATGLFSHVVAVVTPSDCGHWKPRPEMFAAALRALNAPASSCMMIGDSIESDILPARALGMACFHVDRANGQDLSGYGAEASITAATPHSSPPAPSTSRAS